jgi:hypothetical protein
LTPFVAAMAVERSDFEIALEEGTIRRAAKVGGGPPSVEGHSWTNGWPAGGAFRRTRAGKRFAGRVAVTFQRVTAKRGFSVRVR